MEAMMKDFSYLGACKKGGFVIKYSKGKEKVLSSIILSINL